MTDAIKLIEAAQDAFQHRDWARARDHLNAARQVGLLDADGVFTLAEAAWWLGAMDESLAAFEHVAHARRMQELGRRFADPNLSPSASSARVGRGSSRAGWTKAWPCWTRRCWRRSPMSWTRCGPGRSTAT
jgi:hypothetical protein